MLFRTQTENTFYCSLTLQYPAQIHSINIGQGVWFGRTVLSSSYIKISNTSSLKNYISPLALGFATSFRPNRNIMQSPSYSAKKLNHILIIQKTCVNDDNRRRHIKFSFPCRQKSSFYVSQFLVLVKSSYGSTKAQRSWRQCSDDTTLYSFVYEHCKTFIYVQRFQIQTTHNS